MTGSYYGENNRRRYFRVNLNVPLCADMTICEIGGKRVKTGNSKVCVLNIGVGGLAFSSSLEFPIDNKAVFLFSTSIMGKNINFKGTIVRRTKLNSGAYNYGVKFIYDNNLEDEYIRIFNNLSIQLKKNWKGCEYSSCNKDKCPNRK